MSTLTVEVEVEEILTTTEAAKLVGVSPGSIRVALHHGRLAGSKCDGVWLVSRRDVQAWHARVRHVRRAAPPSWEKTASLIAEYGSASAEELAGLAKIHIGNVRKHLAILANRGKIQQRPDGQWVLCDPEAHRGAA